MYACAPIMGQLRKWDGKRAARRSQLSRKGSRSEPNGWEQTVEMSSRCLGWSGLLALSGCSFHIELIYEWTIVKNHVLEAGLTPNHWQTMAFRMLTTDGLLYFIMCEDIREHEFIEIAFSWGSGPMWLHTTLEGPWPHSMILEVFWDGLWTLSFGLTIPWSWLLARVWIGSTDQHFCHQGHLMTLDIQVSLLISWHKYVQ
jgi:hypothetical protein